ncbi:hypothetical protein GCM10011396_08460 [Undibacterium terreum]|uniref:Uncharacterized protein n=1 Tax=Undibacterium terreum TaxID=1224302 RepID=A0A916U954_9BURK|nr:hypothetical protein GCM10011396_08460 [Undibacterium terreum]
MWSPVPRQAKPDGNRQAYTAAKQLAVCSEYQEMKGGARGFACDHKNSGAGEW